MSTEPVHAGSRSFFLRLASAACPSSDRPWLAALFAETSAIESPASRLRWMFGAWALVLGANARQAFAALSNHPLLAVAVAIAGSLLIASPSLAQYEIMNVEDDLFLLAASLFGGAVLGTTVFAQLVHVSSQRVTLGGRP